MKDYKKTWKEYENALDDKRKNRYPYIPIPGWVTKEMLGYESIYRKDVYNLNFGDYFLYQINNVVDGINVVSYPRVGLFIEYLPADQTMELRWIEKLRNWEINFKLNEEDKFLFPESEIKSHYEWEFAIYIFEVWDHKPNWKEIRKAMNKTFYFGNLPRVNKINDLFKNI